MVEIFSVINKDVNMLSKLMHANNSNIVLSAYAILPILYF